MRQRVSVIIPSMNRPAMLRECVSSLSRSVLPPDTELEVCVAIDGDQASIASVTDFDRVGVISRAVMDYSKERRGAIVAWDAALRMAKGDLLAFVGDDCIFDPGWLVYAYAHHREYLGGYGVVGFNDLHREGNTLATHFMVDRKFVKEVLGGRITFPIFKFYCNDTVVNLLSKKDNRFSWCKESIVTHNHYTNQRRQRDALDALNEPLLRDDIDRLERWIQDGCRIEWESSI